MSAQEVTTAEARPAAATWDGQAGWVGDLRRRVPDLRHAPALRLLPSVSPSAPRAPFVTLILGLLSAGMIGLLLLNTVMQQRSFALDAIEKSNALMAERAQVISDELASRQAPSALAEEARRLGMVATPAPVFLDLTDGSIRGEFVPAKAEPGAATSPTAPQIGSGPIQAVQPAPSPKPQPSPTPSPTKPTAGKSAAAKPTTATSAAAKPTTATSAVAGRAGAKPAGTKPSTSRAPESAPALTR